MPAAGKLGGMGTSHLSIARGQILSTVVQLSHLLSSLFQKPDCFEPAVNSSKSLGHIKLNFVQLVSNFPVSENRSRQYKRGRHQYWNIRIRPMIKFSKILAACFPTRCRLRCQVALISPLRPRATLNPDEEARNSTGDSHFHFNCTSVSTVQHTSKRVV